MAHIFWTVTFLLLHIYIARHRLGYGFSLGFQTQWQHCIMQKCSHCMESDSDFNSNCQLQKWDPSPSPCAVM